VHVNNTPKREIFSKAVSEQHYSDSKLKREIPKSLRKNSYIKEKIGENKYIYRLSGQLGRPSTLETMHEEPKEQSLENLQRVEEEEKTVNISKELVLKSISQITGTRERHASINTENENRDGISIKKHSYRISSINKQFEDLKVDMQEKEEEILNLKKENNRLDLKNKELSSMNEVRNFNISC
jgi:hypothetical protein